MENLNIYKVERLDDWGYDDYDSMVVIAEDMEEAASFHPDEDLRYNFNTGKWRNHRGDEKQGFGWVEGDNIIEKLDVKYIGKAEIDCKKGVVVASYNAG